jgi:anaerobic magnesium-protoporphyrin IX monomethyl ester cyclase
MFSKIQFIFTNHTYGHLACREKVQDQPPLGIITLASYIKDIFPEIDVEAYDGRYFSENELVERLDGDLIGFSTWFSNYENAISLAKTIKNIRPSTTIIFGGPHATAIPERILSNNVFVDYVICGEGESAFLKLLKGIPLKSIPGLFFRHDNKIFGNDSWEAIYLDSLPIIDLTLLRPTYSWKSDRESPAMSAFPLSGIRGCMRGHSRCEYCSIPIRDYRCISPNRYWEHVNSLHEQYGIDFFFETGDTFPLKYLKELGSIAEHPDVSFRIYSYPSTLKKDDMSYLKAMGVRTIFMGVESVLHWNGKFKRKYPLSYSIQSLIEEIQMCGEVGIDVIPGFLLGLPGESLTSLNENIELIRKLYSLDNVKEITVSAVMPLPGADYFDWCMNSEDVINEYKKHNSDDLITTDRIDYYLLSQIFSKVFTDIEYENIYLCISELKKEIGSSMANWGIKKPMLNYYS